MELLEDNQSKLAERRISSTPRYVSTNFGPLPAINLRKPNSDLEIRVRNNDYPFYQQIPKHSGFGEMFLSYIALLLLGIYTVMFGLNVLGGIEFGPFEWKYASVLILIFLVDGIKIIAESFTRNEFAQGDEDPTKVGVIIPTHNGAKYIESVIENLCNTLLKQNILVVSNGSTDNTVQLCKEMGIRVINIPDAVGKVVAIHQGVMLMDQPYILVIDDDTYLNGSLIPTSLMDEGYGAVAFRLYARPTNWLSRFQSIEYLASSDLGKRSHNKTGSIQNVSGAIGLYRRDVLEDQLNYHTGEFSGEDLQRSLLLQIHRKYSEHDGIVISESIIETSVPESVRRLFKQRSIGWSPGMYANFGNYCKLLCMRRTPWRMRLESFYMSFLVILMDVLRIWSLPVLIFLPWYFVVMYLAYVLIQMVVWIRCKEKRDAWVVLLYPLYGLFSLLTRLTGFLVFLKRRLLNLWMNMGHKESYKTSPLLLHVCAMVLVIAVLGFFLVLNYQTEIYKSVIG